MSKSEDPIARRCPSGGAEVQDLKAAPNGIIHPMHNKMAAIASQPTSKDNKIMEVDDDDAASFDEETEIILQRDKQYRRAGEYSPVSLQHRTSRPYDVSTMWVNVLCLKRVY
jgi:hypothetical protein